MDGSCWLERAYDDFSGVGTRGQEDTQNLAKELCKFPFYFLNAVTGMLGNNASNGLMKMSMIIIAILKKSVSKFWQQRPDMKMPVCHLYYLGWSRLPAHAACMRQVLGPGALGRPRGMGWRGRREGGSGWGTYVNPWLIHVNVWQKPLQYYKVISLQLIKINEKKENACLLNSTFMEGLQVDLVKPLSSTRITLRPHVLVTLEQLSYTLLHETRQKPMRSMDSQIQVAQFMNL